MGMNVKIINNKEIYPGLIVRVSQGFDEFEFENFLLFYINAIEYSINQINSIKEEKIKCEKSFLYHFICDNILFYIDKIHDRFLHIKKCDKDFEKYKEEYNNYVDKQNAKFEFTKEKFPILIKKLPRNWMVHIVEKNYLEIKENGGIN